MEIKLTNNGYLVLESGVVILSEAYSDLKLSIKATETFSFDVILKFDKDETEKHNISKEVDGNKLVLRCLNFNNTLGTGTIEPVSIATVSGKEWFLHFWSYLMGERNVRKVEYTLLEKNG